MALQAEEDESCPGCGLPLSETTDENYPYFYDGHHLECIACEAKHEYRETLEKDGHLRPGTIVTVSESSDRVSDSDLQASAANRVAHQSD